MHSVKGPPRRTPGSGPIAPLLAGVICSIAIVAAATNAAGEAGGHVRGTARHAELRRDTAAPVAPRIIVQGSSFGAVACASCHGLDGPGGGRGAFPRLAGSSEQYLRKQLQDYRADRRRNAIMQPIARAMTTTELEDAVRWYAAARPPVTMWDEGATTAAIARGARLARDGEWSRKLPACSSCHGSRGEGVPPNFPGLRGQSPTYVEAQLVAFRQGWRANDSLGLMRAVAHRTKPGDGRAVGQYFASLERMALSRPVAGSTP